MRRKFQKIDYNLNVKSNYQNDESVDDLNNNQKETKKNQISKLSDFYNQIKSNMEYETYNLHEIYYEKQDYFKEFEKEISESIDVFAGHIRISIAESIKIKRKCWY